MCQSMSTLVGGGGREGGVRPKGDRCQSVPVTFFQCCFCHRYGNTPLPSPLLPSHPPTHPLHPTPPTTHQVLTELSQASSR
jgi:hypothetical protein